MKEVMKEKKKDKEGNKFVGAITIKSKFHDKVVGIVPEYIYYWLAWSK